MYICFPFLTLSHLREGAGGEFIKRAFYELFSKIIIEHLKISDISSSTRSFI